MFTALIVKPVFNLLVIIYALVPGHNFGLSIILFTILVRLLMWPLVKKQLHQTKVMRAVQPELKRIKAAAKGDRQKESAMMMELYKERGINPLASLGSLVIQVPIFIGLYQGLRRIVEDPHTIVTFSYSWVRDLSWVQTIAKDINRFDGTLFGVVDLTKAAIDKAGALYWPAMLIVIGSAVVQYYQAKQLMPQDKEKKSLRTILKEAGEGKQADQSEIQASMGRFTQLLLPGFIFLVTVNIASALSLYWLTSGIVAFLQQARVLSQDAEEMVDATDVKTSKAIEAEIIPPKPKTKPKNKNAKNKKRRR